MIVVVNRHTFMGKGMYIGRGTIFGNPDSHKGYPGTIKVATREESINKYALWGADKWENDIEFKEAIIKLAAKYLLDEDIILICSCKPLSCHGDILKASIERTAKDLKTEILSQLKKELKEE